MEIATLASGCFWCGEAIFRRLKGVERVRSGYSGNGKPNPTYEEVSTGTTPYVEAVQIEFNPEIISFEKLLEVFWATHDPTTPDRQGNDVGPQYRSVIFYHSDTQKITAEKSFGEEGKKYDVPIVTSIEPYTHFYDAEQEHRDFYERNRSYGYCRLIIDPKIRKLYKDFKADAEEK